MGISQYKKPLLWAFIGAVGFGILASQTGILGKIGSLPEKVSSKIA
jgi:hypothetical protein